MSIILLCLLRCVVDSSAETAAVERIRCSGNRVFSDAELVRMLGVERGQQLDAVAMEAAGSRLVDSLIARDLLFARTDSIRGERGKRGTVLTVFVTEGSTAVVDELHWAGDSGRVADANADLLLTRGASFQWSRLRADLNRLLDQFTSAGYPYARVELERVDADSTDHTVDLYLKLTSGPFTEIEFVEFSGLRGTSEAFLRRYLRFRVPVPYSDAAVARGKRRLARLDFLRSVGDPRIVVREDGSSGVQFPVEEARATRLDAVAGYLPGEQGKNGTVSGLVNLDFINLLGSGRKGHVHWARPDSRTQSVEIAYREPWVLNSPLSLAGDFSQRIDDTSYVTRKMGVVADAELGSNVVVTGAVRFEAVLVDSASAVRLGLANSSTVVFETGLAIDTRDFPPNPRRGFRFATTVGSGTKRRERLNDSLDAGRFGVRRVSADAEAVAEPLPYWVASLALHARGTESDEPEIPVSDMYRLGGARTLRGYREEQFQGSRLGWASAELRYLLGEASRLYLFADAGAIYREVRTASGPASSSLFRPATGVGLRLESTLGTWGFDYGVGQDDRVLNGKVHFSLFTSF
ncbi:BamA/TamA family outer membrane protein [candidate division KSB1 bacterium]|nr:BamA/TamA family outer membrane protein [candidate division KSB1 bacterium]